jgi:hypothetical protein
MDSSADQRELQKMTVNRMKGGATSIELLHWLREEHGVTGKAGQALLQSAARERRGAVRKEGAMGILVSVILLIVTGGLAAISFTTDFSEGLYCSIGAGLSVLCLMRCICRVITAGREEAMVWEV